MAEKWKYDFITKLRDEISKTRNSGEIIKALMSTGLRIHGQEISKLTPKLLDDETKIMQTILSQEIEFEALKGAAEKYEKEFKCKFEFVAADNTEEKKAKQALPGKSAILIE